MVQELLIYSILSSFWNLSNSASLELWLCRNGEFAELHEISEPYSHFGILPNYRINYMNYGKSCPSLLHINLKGTHTNIQMTTKKDKQINSSKVTNKHQPSKTVVLTQVNIRGNFPRGNIHTSIFVLINLKYSA